MDFGSFKFLTGDVNFTDHGGKWYRKVAPGRYHVIELSNGHGGSRYNVTLCEVDLFALACPNNEGTAPLCGALRSCGYALDAEQGIVNEYDGELVAKFGPVFELVCVEAAHGYGCKAHLSDEYGSNWRKLMKAASRESRSLDDPDAYAEAMDRPVNALGTSARNYMLGNIFSKAFYESKKA